MTDECLRCGLSVNLVRGSSAGFTNCLRMAPPLTIGAEEVGLALEILDDALTTQTASVGVGGGPAQRLRPNAKYASGPT